MLKKIILILLLIISSLFIFSDNLVFAKATCSWNWSNRLKWDEAKNCINRAEFTIKTEIFSPGWWETLRKAKIWWWKTEETSNIILWEIIRNLIVVFWVLSLFVMTIGWGYMIFHSWEESLLTRWKTMLKYWIVSLIIALSSGVMVKLVTWLLY